MAPVRHAPHCVHVQTSAFVLFRNVTTGNRANGLRMHRASNRFHSQSQSYAMWLGTGVHTNRLTRWGVHAPVQPAKWPCHRKTMATPKTATAMIPQACGSKDRQGRGPMATHAHGMLCHSHRCTRIPTRRPHGAFETTSTHRSSTPTQTYIMRIWCTARSKARCLWVWG